MGDNYAARTRWLGIVTDYPLRDAAGFQLALAFLTLNFHHDGKDGFSGVAHILQRLQGEAGADV